MLSKTSQIKDLNIATSKPNYCARLFTKFSTVLARAHAEMRLEGTMQVVASEETAARGNIRNRIICQQQHFTVAGVIVRSHSGSSQRQHRTPARGLTREPSPVEKIPVSAMRRHLSPQGAMQVAQTLRAIDRKRVAFSKYQPPIHRWQDCCSRPLRPRNHRSPANAGSRSASASGCGCR